MLELLHRVCEYDLEVNVRRLPLSNFRNRRLVRPRWLLGGKVLGTFFFFFFFIVDA